MRKRGRPPKFDSPSRLVTMTLPEDVIATLRARNPDLAEAVVAVVGDSGGKARRRSSLEKKAVDLVRIASRRFVIAIDASAVTHLPGCELVPFGSGGAILALEQGRGLEDLTLAVLDRLEEPRLEQRERNALITIRSALRAWMRDPRISIYTRSIVVMLRSATAFLLPWNAQGEFLQLGRIAQWGTKILVQPEAPVFEHVMKALALA